MVYQVGDTVIHLVHGIGDIENIEDRKVHGDYVRCYVVRTSDLTIWVPINAEDQHTLRAPTSKNEFKNLYSVLQDQIEPLPEERLERKKQLNDLLKDGQLSSICRVVRDLSSYRNDTKLSDEDKSILERATNTLLAEWTFSLSIPLSQARQNMLEMLDN